jgi:hypothetical protein
LNFNLFVEWKVGNWPPLAVTKKVLGFQAIKPRSETVEIETIPRDEVNIDKSAMTIINYRLATSGRPQN